MKKALVITVLAVVATGAFPFLVSAQETYRFERMLPVLKQPWYFFKPADVAKDSLGNIYVTDWGHHRVLKFTQDGSFVTAWGREGTGIGQFRGVRGIATHEETIDGVLFIYVYVLDDGNNRIAKFSSDGSLIWQRSVLREPGEAELWLNRIAIDAEGYLYITDYTNNCVKKLSEGAGKLTTVNKWGSQSSGDFTWPCGIAVDAASNIYVADNGNDRIQKINQDDNTISPWYGYGASQALFDEPYGIALDDAQNIYVTNNGNGLIQQFSPDGVIASWQFDGEPDGIAVVPAGYVFVLEWTENTGDEVHKRIVKLSPEGNPLAVWASEGDGNGKFNQPYGISLHEEAGEPFVYVSDTFNNRIQKFSSEGEWIKTWGAPEWSFNYPEGITVDAAGSIYVADENNHLVRKINPDDSSSTWSLGGTYYPYSVAVEPGGLTIYVAAREGMLFYRILKVNTETGDFSVWGSGFNQPHGVAIGPDGYVYVADTGNNSIKKCNADGICSTCGSGLKQPVGVAVDAASNIYVADTGNDRIQIFDQNGIYRTTLGGPGSMPGQFSYPTNLAVSADGKQICVSDTGNNRIQVFGKFEVLTNPRAIIVAGGGPYRGNNLWDATQATANFAYRTLIYRGFTDDDIYYLSSDFDLDIDNDGFAEVDSQPTISDLQYAITEWALNENAKNLILYLDDHGGPDTFRLSETETLTAAQINSWLDAFEAGTSGKVTVIYEACESGSFMDNLQGNDRIIITSTLPGEQAKFLSQGTLSFSNFFWTNILNGLSIGESYLKAVDIVNFAFSNQNPQLTGDAQNIYIGGGISDIIGAAPQISNVSEPQEINEDESSALLYAEGVTDPDGIARVWAVIWPPDYVPDSSDNPLITLPSCELLPAGGDRYAGKCSEFTTDRTYPIAIYAMDRNNNTSQPQLTTVSRNYRVERQAIIVAGGSSAGVTRSTIENNAGIAYDALKAQLYADDEIYLMSATVFSEEYDAGSYLSNLEDQLDILAGDRGIENLDLTIYLIGKGNGGPFTMNDEADPDILSALKLDELLDDLQAAKPGSIKIIYDGDKSGSFITPLDLPDGSERIIIASSAEDGTAYFSGAGDICFSSFFWGQVAGGATLYNAFSYARQAIAYLSLKNEISFSCYPPQNPVLDANGDGMANKAADYKVARERTIGIGLRFAADLPSIGSASVEEDGGVVTITAANITATSEIQRVWAEIKPIAYCPGNSGEEPQELTEVNLAAIGDGTYEGPYSGPFNAFKATVYAMDKRGNTSEPSETKLYQAGGYKDIYEDPDINGVFDDDPAEANVIVINYPSSQPHTFHYEGDEDWVKFYGKEGQDYTVEADNLNQNCPIIMELYRKGDLEEYIEIRESIPGDDYLRFEYNYPESDIYYVRLAAKTDACTWGEGISYSYDLSVYDNNLGLTALVAGKVRDSVSGTLIDGAVITSNGIGAAISTRGEYIFSEVPGSWSITARKERYASSRDSIRIEADDEYIRQNIGMYPVTSSACTTADDCDDGIFCNGAETCVDKTCQPGANPCPDDGIFCNGVETCSEEADSCGHAGNPCLENLTCDEERDACVGCLEDADCDDGFFCTGTERCFDGACQDGANPCPEGVACDEDADECMLPTLEVIPRTIMQSHWMPLPVFMSIRGTNTHFGNSSSLVFNPQSVVGLPMMINPKTILCFGLMMPAWITQQAGDSLEVSVTTGTENATGSVDLMLLPFMLGEEKQGPISMVSHE